MSDRFDSEDWLAEAKAALPKKTCPQCGSVGTLKIERRLVAKPIGTFSLAGGQMKVSAKQVTILECNACNLKAKIDPT